VTGRVAGPDDAERNRRQTVKPAVTLLTIGQIAKRLNEPLHRVRYALDRRGIEPVGRAGNVRVFAETDLDRIAAALTTKTDRAEGSS
jgi:hypothetical protein